MRYFRSTPSVYGSICSQLDAAYGYPNAETKTDRTLPLVETLPTDAQGRVYLAILADYCEYILPSDMLPQLLSSGIVQEIDLAAYNLAEAATMLQVNPPQP